jgi:hypothetical protein
MIRRHLVPALGICLLLLAGCGDDATGPTTPVDVTGTWNASGTDGNGAVFTLILTLTQSGTTVSGTGQIVNVITGTISGSVTGNTLTFQYSFPATSCAGTLNGTATASCNQLDGTFSGTTQCMGTVRASFRGLRRT